MSNSVVFLLIAVGLSILGSLVVWVHGRLRRPRSSVDLFRRGLRTLSGEDGRFEPQSGVVLRRHQPDDPTEPASDGGSAPAPRARRPSPRPSPRPAARARQRPSEPEGTHPGA